MAQPNPHRSSTKLRILHFNDVYQVRHAAICASQFAKRLSDIQATWSSSADATAAAAAAAASSVQPISTPTGEHDTRPARPGGLTLFSGDLYNPSVESSVTRGEHMNEVLNHFHVDVACIGNHDFDFGFPHLQKLISGTNFPWTFSNIKDVGSEVGHDGEEPQEGDRQVQGTREFVVKEVDGLRVGLVGLVEEDWIETVPSFPPNFRYRSMAPTARRLSQILRDPTGPHRCDLVIGLTHSRLPNDIDLANEVGALRDVPRHEHGLDLLLGGHDHIYALCKGISGDFQGKPFRTPAGSEKDQGCMVVKSGTDFQDLSEIELDISEVDEKAVRRRIITGARVKRHSTQPDDPKEEAVSKVIDGILGEIDAATSQPVCFSLTPWDTRSDRVRMDESAIGNFVADILLWSYHEAVRDIDRKRGSPRSPDSRSVDLALICGGSLRGDSCYGPGPIPLRTVLEIAPFTDSVVVRELTGRQIWDALENGFGAYPRQEGRFPQVSGLRIQWDSRRPAGKRVVSVHLTEDGHLFKKTDGPEASKVSRMDFAPDEDGTCSVEIHRPKGVEGSELEMERIYRVVTREYMADGHDGYGALVEGRDIINHENGSLMSTLIRKFLLGATLLWRLRQLRVDQEGEENNKEEESLLSGQTQAAVQRARAIARRSHLGRATRADGDGDGDAEGDGGGEGDAKGPSTETQASPTTPHSAPLPTKPRLSDGPASHSTPAKRLRSEALVIDSSPGSIRDAFHASHNEHHSHHDVVWGQRRRRRAVSGFGSGAEVGAGSAPNTLTSRNGKKDGEMSRPPIPFTPVRSQSVKVIPKARLGGMDSSTNGLAPLTPGDGKEGKENEENGPVALGQGSEAMDAKALDQPTRQQVGASSEPNDNANATATATATADAKLEANVNVDADIKEQVGVSVTKLNLTSKEVEMLKEASESLAVVAPLRDGRLRDLGREGTELEEGES